MVGGPDNTEGFPTPANRGDMNEKGTTYEIYFSAMGREEVQDQQNDDDVLDIFPIDILLCHWKANSGKLMLRITGLNGLSEDVVEAEDVKVDYTDTLSIYLVGMSIGVKIPGVPQLLGG